jgi:hypothetical protein
MGRTYGTNGGEQVGLCKVNLGDSRLDWEVILKWMVVKRTEIIPQIVISL